MPVTKRARQGDASGSAEHGAGAPGTPRSSGGDAARLYAPFNAGAMVEHATEAPELPRQDGSIPSTVVLAISEDGGENMQPVIAAGGPEAGGDALTPATAVVDNDRRQDFQLRLADLCTEYNMELPSELAEKPKKKKKAIKKKAPQVMKTLVKSPSRPTTPTSLTPRGARGTPAETRAVPPDELERQLEGIIDLDSQVVERTLYFNVGTPGATTPRGEPRDHALRAELENASELISSQASMVLSSEAALGEQSRHFELVEETALCNYRHVKGSLDRECALAQVESSAVLLLSDRLLDEERQVRLTQEQAASAESAIVSLRGEAETAHERWRRRSVELEQQVAGLQNQVADQRAPTSAPSATRRSS